LPFALTGFLRFRGWRRWGCGAIALLFTSAIVVTNSRGGFVGLVAAAFLCFIASRNRVRNLVVATLVGLIFYFAVPASYKQEMSTISQTSSGTADQRFFLWAAAVNMWREHPLLGVGAANFKWEVGTYQPRAGPGERFGSGQYQERDWSATVTHSLYFEALSELGTLGCLALVGMIVGHFSGLRRLSRRVGAHPGLSPELRNEAGAYAVALSAAMVGYLAAGAFLSVTFYPYPWYLSAMAVAWERVVDRELAGSKLRESSNAALVVS
jgi:O-antigen ligase